MADRAAAAAGGAMRYVIVNADDFGNSEGINRGIIEAHQRGIVTSASLMVNTPATGSAVRLAREHPDLGIGLHVNFRRGGEGEALVDPGDLGAVERELQAQFDRFVELTGRLPTHIDSHQHAHREFNVGRCFLELSRRHGLPLRGYCEVVYLGQFYGQWEYGKTEERYVGVDHLIAVLRATRPGFTEVSCHPGYVVEDFHPVYNREREIELASLTDRRVREVIAAEGLVLISYRDLPRLAAAQSRLPH
jgi:predicted glycoside hydrolase/deacetylase ChbG (UPF0249 family)